MNTNNVSEHYYSKYLKGELTDNNLGTQLWSDRFSGHELTVREQDTLNSFIIYGATGTTYRLNLTFSEYESESIILPRLEYVYLKDHLTTNQINDIISFNITSSKDTLVQEIIISAYETIKPITNVTNLTYELNTNDIMFSYEIPEIDNFSHVELHQDGLLLVDNIETNNFTVTKLEYDTNYSFTFYVVDTDGNKSNGITREILIPENPNLIPSGNIFNLTHSVTDTTVNFKYNLPTDDRFSHLKVYRNNELITDTYNLSEYTDRELEPETEYEYRFVTVNKENILSNGYTITIKTAEENDDVPPAIPTGLTAKGMNAGIMLTWNGNTESDLQGYYIYIDGEKNNNTPIRNNYYNLTNLNNDQTYNIQVSAVDTFNNESEKTSVRTALPNADEMPILELDTNLSSIAGSVENWFSEIWLLVAFASAIPLAFMIGSRVKALFIA